MQTKAQPTQIVGNLALAGCIGTRQPDHELTRARLLEGGYFLASTATGGRRLVP